MDAKHTLLSQNDSEEEEVVLHEVKSPDDLEFRNIPMSGGSTIKTPQKSGSFTSFPNPGSGDDGDDKTELLEGERKPLPMWTFEYYQTWFDVDTKQVGKRILGSMTPRPGRNYLRADIRPNPDLYGPFWVCTTLVFTTAICGNLANYISCGRYDYQWTYDFHKVTLAAAAIFSYWWLIPTGVYGLMVWRAHQSGYSYMEIICVYGYSLSIYIPISILWVIPFGWLQWTLVLIGTLLSGSVLLFTFWPVLREDVDRKLAAVVMSAMLLFHAALAAGFVLYFFHVPDSSCPHDLKPSMDVITTRAPPRVNTARFNQQVPASQAHKLNDPSNPLTRPVGSQPIQSVGQLSQQVSGLSNQPVGQVNQQPVGQIGQQVVSQQVSGEFNQPVGQVNQQPVGQVGQQVVSQQVSGELNQPVGQVSQQVSGRRKRTRLSE